jgi:hypothetical protein
MNDSPLPYHDPQTMMEIQLLRPDLEEARRTFLKAEAAARIYAGTPGAKEFVLNCFSSLMDRGCNLEEDFMLEGQTEL